MPISQRKEIAILGTETTQRDRLESNTIEGEDEFELKSCNDRKKRELEGFTSVYPNHQKRDAPAVDETLIGKCIEFYLSLIWMKKVQQRSHGGAVEWWKNM